MVPAIPRQSNPFRGRLGARNRMLLRSPPPPLLEPRWCLVQFLILLGAAFDVFAFVAGFVVAFVVVIAFFLVGRLPVLLVSGPGCKVSFCRVGNPARKVPH